jgi:hypothetical protein
METETEQYFIHQYPIKSLHEISDIKYRKPNQATLHLAIVAFNETQHWADDIQTKANGPIYGIYLVDLTQPSHCCSFQVDYPSYFIMNHFANVSAWQDANGDWLPGMDDEMTNLERNAGDDTMSYLSGRSSGRILDEVRRSNKEYRKELSGSDNDHDKWIEEYIEYYLGNSPI